MLTIKNRAGWGLVGRREHLPVNLCNLLNILVSLVLLSGCTPAGPRALLEGKRMIDQEQYQQAIQKLKGATSLLGGTNALAWNYLGVAYQHVGADAEAEWAYQRALALNHDLNEVQFNRGCLWLAQNKLEAAKAEFTACTLRRPNAPEGFLKLGEAQLRSRDPSAADKSFSEALRLSPHNPEALNELGLARLQRGRASEAAQCFEKALKQQPDYHPALLNLAIVSHQYLKDRQMALQKYREYLALKPPPADSAALVATVRQLEQELNLPVRHPATDAVGQPYLNANPPKAPATNGTRIASAPKQEPAPGVPKPTATNVPKSATTNGLKPAPAIVSAPTAKVEVVKLPAEPVLKRAEDVSIGLVATQASPAEPVITTSSLPASARGSNSAKRGLFQRLNPFNLFHSGEKTPVRPTPLESLACSTQGKLAKTGARGPDLASVGSPPPGSQWSSARYIYKSPPLPSPGNRSDAERSFGQGEQAHQAHQLSEAIQAYRLATRQDPSLFEAHYNLGLVATEAGNLSLALMSYEDALAVQPTSLDARYNFALVLKQANYLTDAVNELERVLTGYPNETRAHLALGNLYADQMRQPSKARQHYLKVLEVEPHHPQASRIHFWLNDHQPQRPVAGMP
jgi:Flp pilus assembly protein TadD